MGLGGVLARKVFFKNRNSNRNHDGQERHIGADKGKWSSVRNYLCGDEVNSLLAEDDFASTGSAGANVRQSTVEEQIAEDEENLQINLSSQEKAAIIIQSAFRGFRIWRQYQELKLLAKTDENGEFEQQSEATEALSTIAQVGDCIEEQEAQEAIAAISHRIFGMCRIKEEWDDSVLSSNVLKLRIQNRLEAMTRRERALAYAFSQQLRTCSKKKRANFDAPDPGKGWSWLERWMAARSPTQSMADGCLNMPICNCKRQIVIRKRLDVAFEEKESCGSNDVPTSFNGPTEASQAPASEHGPVKSMLKATKSVTRRRRMPEYHQKKKEIERERSDRFGGELGGWGGGRHERIQGAMGKGTRGGRLLLADYRQRDSSREAEKEKRCKLLHSKSIREIKFKGAP
ncbi:Protein IQ-DOMAIN 14 [Platanthera guangdongensis]|uniref:Protein IQ-DOMAIN 14 n=1 Tax=Platanthera guangdongensis TaxID=2320717 RepID=A0ABR2ME92_9ASPA